MDPKSLDKIFPYFLFVYGLIFTFFFPVFLQKIEGRMPGHWLERLRTHLVLAPIGLAFGGFWLLQRWLI